MLMKFGAKDILIGHSLESDLKALKVKVEFEIKARKATSECNLKALKVTDEAD